MNRIVVQRDIFSTNATRAIVEDVAAIFRDGGWLELSLEWNMKTNLLPD